MIYFNECFTTKILPSFNNINKEYFVFNLYNTIIKLKTCTNLSNNDNIIIQDLINRCKIYKYFFNIIKQDYYNNNPLLNFELDIFTNNSIKIFDNLTENFNNYTPYIKYSELTNNQLKDLYILLEFYLYNKNKYINYNLNLTLFNDELYFDITTDIYGNTLINNIIFEDTDKFINKLLVEILYQLYINTSIIYY